MTDFYKYKLCRVSSEDGINANDTNTSFTVKLEGVEHPAKNFASGVRLEQFVMGNYFYNVRTGVNDVFSFQENGFARLDHTLTEGVYTLTDLMSALQTAIAAYLTTASAVTVTENNITRKVEITLTGNTGRVVVDDTNIAASTVGFDTSTVYAATSTAQSSARLFGLEQIYIECRELAQSHLFDTANNNFRPVLKVLQVDKPYGQKIEYKNDIPNDRILWGGKRNLNKLTFRLTNGDGDVLDSNAVSDHCKIILNFLY